jgi:hypothetical protein
MVVRLVKALLAFRAVGLENKTSFSILAWGVCIDWDELRVQVLSTAVLWVWACMGVVGERESSLHQSLWLSFV